MYQFSAEKVFNAAYLSKVEPKYVTQISYYWGLQNLQVLQDQKTIVGVEYNEKKNFSEIVIEDITNKDTNYSPVRIQTNGCFINTILIDEHNGFMLTGDGNGRVLQFSLNFSKDLGKLIKDYGELGVGWIDTSIMFGNLAVFGGEKSSLGFIDTGKCQYLGIKDNLAVENITSIELCWVKQAQAQSKALLTICGRNYDYSSSKTDVLDITQLIPENLKNKMEISIINNKNKSLQRQIQVLNDLLSNEKKKNQTLKNENNKLNKLINKKIQKIKNKLKHQKIVNNTALIKTMKHCQNKMKSIIDKKM